MIIQTVAIPITPTFALLSVFWMFTSIIASPVGSTARLAQRVAFIGGQRTVKRTRQHNADHAAAAAQLLTLASRVRNPSYIFLQDHPACSPSPLFLSSSPTEFQSMKPYNATTHRRTFSSTSSSTDSSTWTVPNSVNIPADSIDMTFIKSSGAGGQNVNKVNTQVQIRFHVPSATWMPAQVRERFQQQQVGRINKENYFSLQVQEHRTQSANRKAAMDRLEEMVLQAWVRPKERKMRQGISKKAKAQRKEMKQRRSMVKQSRRGLDDY
jgi:hypothetical protein